MNDSLRESYAYKRVILDKGFADFLKLEPRRELWKIEATLVNTAIQSEKKYCIDRALYGRYSLVELQPSTMSGLFMARISMYIVEKLFGWLRLEAIR